MYVAIKQRYMGYLNVIETINNNMIIKTKCKRSGMYNDQLLS
jgi:hypothetical protein